MGLHSIFRRCRYGDVAELQREVNMRGPLHLGVDADDLCLDAGNRNRKRPRVVGKNGDLHAQCITMESTRWSVWLNLCSVKWAMLERASPGATETVSSDEDNSV